MALEVATFVSDLDANNPVASDKKNQGDDHFRLVKTVLKTTFPNASKAIYFPDSVSKSANYVVLSTDMETIFSVSAGTLTLPTLVSGDAGWAVSVLKDATGVTPIYVVPPSGTIISRQLTVAKVRIDVPYVQHRFTWLGASFIHDVQGVLAPGCLEPYAGATAPTGHAFAIGQSLLRADHPELFGYWSTTWGAADGTHFNAPDLRDRFLVGAGSTYALGATGGSATHILALSEIPPIDPTITVTDNRTWATAADVLKPGTGPGTGAGGGIDTGSSTVTPTGTITADATAVGGGGAHENRPPYLGMNYIFRLC